MSSDPEVIGKSVTVDGVPHTVVGIAPEDFRGHFHFFQAPGSLLFIPLERHPRLRANPNLRNDRTVDWVRMLGRLDPGVDITRANGLVSATVSGLAQRYPDDRTNSRRPRSSRTTRWARPVVRSRDA